jgi:tetratricopeptide (TPR) repeat protein
MNWEHFRRDITAGNAMVDAGSLDAAVRHCKSALDQDLTHVDVYALQVRILSAKNRPEEALRITERRIESVPDCRHAHLQRVRLLGSMNRAGLAKTAMAEVRNAFTDDPMMVHDCQLMHDITLDRNSYVLKRIAHLRETGYWGILDLDDLEQTARANAGHVTTLGRLQQADLERGDIDPETLHLQSVVRYLQGRLISSRKLAAQASVMDPLSAPIHAETRFAALLGMIPLLWPAQFFIILTGSITSRFPWWIRIFTNYVLAILAIGLLILLLSAIHTMPFLSDTILGFVSTTTGIANVVWALYIIWAFGSVGRWRANRAKKFKISEDY